MRRFHYDNEDPDYSRLKGIGGWLVFLIIRLLFSVVSAATGIVTAIKQNKAEYIVIYSLMLIFAVTVIILIFMRKKQLRFAYYAFSFTCLADYYIAQNGTAFIASVLVEAGWILYLLVSVRVKLLLGEINLPDDDSSGELQH